MALSTGTRLGPYEIVALLGAGGMGEVYRARDIRLDRTIAVKVLNSALVATPEARSRFEREAKVISHLQHPHICVLHDVGSENGTDFLVMEFLEGESLSDRLRRGPLPTSELLKVAIEVAGALARAHRAGIIHRDLKPGNVMLTKTGAKLLDFGLAKPKAAAAAAASSSQSIFSAAQTMTSPASPLSSAGAVIGTVQYMAPEQIQGLEADARSDIFGFGTMLYEMATGKRAFEGKTQSSVVGQILAVDPPPISVVQPMSPPALCRLVSTCLAKDPEERFQTIHDMKLRLMEIAESPATIAGDSRARRTDRRIWVAAGAVIVALALSGTYFAFLTQQPKQILRTTILPPDKTVFVTTPPDSGAPVLSPDGAKLAFVARDSKGYLSLYFRSMNSLTSQQLPGTMGGIHPFWAPDSHNLGFFADGKLKRIDTNDGQVQELAAADRGRGGTWSRDGTILFTSTISGPLMRVAAGGGTAVPASKLAPGETGHRWPYFLPDGQHFLFWARGAKSYISIGSLDSLDHRAIIENATNATFAPPGYLLFARGDTLVAQPFSLRKLDVFGDAVPIAQQVAKNSASFRGVFSTSDNGMLVYQASGTSGGGWQMQWAGRDGKTTGTLPDVGNFLYPAISPDGKRVAVTLDSGGNVDVWIFDVARGTKTRLTFDPALDAYPVWTPDGKKIIFSSTRNGHYDFYSKAADGSGNDELIYHDDSDKTWESISGDGRYLAYERLDPAGKTGQDIWVLPLFGDRKPFPVVETPFQDSSPAISPDGKWVAYSNDESRRREIYITSVSGGGPKWQVSSAGGLSPKWRGDGKQLCFLSYDATVNAVDVDASAASITLGTPHQLFTHTLQGLNFGAYDITRDGKQFLLNGSVSLEGEAPLTLVTNWAAELKK